MSETINTKIYLDKLNKYKKRLTELELQHVGKELNFTYWGGYSMGYLKGQISILENILDDLNIDF